MTSIVPVRPPPTGNSAHWRHGAGPNPGGGVKGTALTIVAMVGGGFALLALVGGLVGASLALRKRRRG